MTASAGVAEIDAHDTWSSWLNRADQALYQAKNEGRDRVVTACGNPDMAQARNLP